MERRVDVMCNIRGARPESLAASNGYVAGLRQTNPSDADVDVSYNAYIYIQL